MAVQIFGQGFVIMIVLISLGVLMAFSGGMVIDALTMGSTGELLLNNTEIPISTEWRDAQFSQMWFLINLYYFLCYALPILGIIQFIQSMLPRTSGDQYG